MMISVRRSITSEISEDISDDITRKSKKSITLQMSEDIQNQIDEIACEHSEVPSNSFRQHCRCSGRGQVVHLQYNARKFSVKESYLARSPT